MNKKELKQLIKPIVKECVKEALLEEGVLSNIVKEVTKGVTSGMPLMENKTIEPQKVVESSFQEKINTERVKKTNQKINNYRQQLIDSIGKEAYNGVNLFEGTAPLNAAGDISDNTPRPGNVLGEDSSDSGVALTGPLSQASKLWSKLI